MKKVNITFGFGALICLLAWLDLHACVRFLIAMVVHEGGHLVVMHMIGVPVCGVSFKVAGAVIEGCFSGHGQQVACAAAGPFFSFLLGFCCLRSYPELAMVSCLLGAVNLLPVYPLDGGRILCGLLLYRLSPIKTEQVLRIVTSSVCCLFMVCACWTAVELQAGLWPIFASLVVLWRVGQAGWRTQE